MTHHLAPHVATELATGHTLHVIGVVTNTERYHSRYRLARDFMARMAATPGVALHMVEGVFGDRKPELADDDPVPVGHTADGRPVFATYGPPRRPKYDVHRVRLDTNIWLKENLINYGVRRLPADWRYVAWVDCDVEFRSPTWATDTLHQLQHFPLLQPWEHCSDLAFGGGVLATHTSFGAVDQSGVRKQTHPGEPYKYAHSGYAWACTRRFWEETGGLLDCAILGSGDHHQAWAAIGQVDKSVHTGMSDGFKRACHEWQRRAARACNGEVGFVPGRIEHHFHGAKAARKYRERWQILIDHAFDPETDLRRDEQGLWRLHSKPALEADIRKYNRARNEDSIDA